MKILVPYIIILFIYFILIPVLGNSQETSTGRVLGEIAGEVLVNKAGFTEEEKEVIFRYYHGFKAQEDDWRNPENNVSNYHWDSDDNDGDDSVSGKKDKQKGKNKAGKNMPPGLAKKNELPPGLQKQLEKNGTLPPGLAKRDLPDDLASKLPKRTRTQQRKIINNDVVLIETATGIILDILYGVGRVQ